MKTTAILCGLALAGAVTAFGQEAPAKLTLHDALTRALDVNEQVERSREEIGVAEANRRYIFSQVLPRLNLNGATTKNSREVTFGNGNDTTTVLPGTDWNYRFVLSQPVYAGNRDRRAYEQARITIRNAREGVRGTEDAVLLRVASNYLAIVDADRSIDVEKHNIALAEKRKQQASAFYEAGESTKVDVLRAETAIKAAQRALAVAQQARANAEGLLRADLNLGGPIDVTDPGHVLPPLPEESSLVARAEASRPDITTAVNNVQSAELEVRKQRGFWYPVVTFEAGYLQQKAAFPASQYGYGKLNFTIPIWQSGEVQARVAGAKERELQARSLLDENRITAREDVHRALVDLQTATTSLNLANDQLAAAEAEYNQSFELYRAQEATSLDVATSEQSLAEARRAVAAETLNRDLAELRVWYAAGALKDAVGVATAGNAADASREGRGARQRGDPATQQPAAATQQPGQDARPGTTGVNE